MGLREVRRVAAPALLLLGLASAACRKPPDPEVEAYLASVNAAEAPFAVQTTRFAVGQPRPDEARAVVEQAIAARDAVEALRVSPRLADARNEELLFLNHMIPAYGRFAQSDGGPAALEQLRATIARGVAHQKRGRKHLPG